ncbi:hypothetical protein EBZ35_05675, partial [bacterium]|nr:hypothetical protein [bacterium]
MQLKHLFWAWVMVGITAIFSLAGPLVYLETTLSDPDLGVLNGLYRVRISVQSSVVLRSSTLSGNSLWSETFDYQFVSGNMVAELGRSIPIPESLFLQPDLSFVVEVLAKGSVSIPIRPVPLSVSSFYAATAGSVSAEGIQGDIPPSRLTGAYPNITQVGTLASLQVSGDLVVNNTLYVRGSSGMVGIQTPNPEAALDVSGSIRIRNGGIIFPDGSRLGSAIQDAPTATGVSGSGTVTLQATSLGSTLGRFVFRSGTTDRAWLTNTGLGIGVSNPIDALEVAGAIRIATGDQSVSLPGTIRFFSGRFQGFNGTAWADFGVPPQSDGVWSSDSSTNTIFFSPSVGSPMVGIGTTQPRSTLEVVGTIRADIVSANQFIGSGSGLTSLNVEALTGVLPVAKGGTGVGSFDSSGVMVYDSAKGALTTLALPPGSLLGADRNGMPTASQFLVGPGLVLTTSDAQWVIAHATVSSQVSMNRVPGVAITGLTVDAFGHVLSVATDNFDARYISVVSANQQFLSRVDPVISGTIRLGVGGAIIPNDRSPLILAPIQGNVGIGVTNPAQKLDIGGAIRIGDTSVDKEGSIRYRGGRFEVFNSSGVWVRIDNRNPLNSALLSAAGWEWDGQRVYTVDPLARVGIGTTQPFYPLSVSGDMAVSSELWVSGNVIMDNGGIRLGTTQLGADGVTANQFSLMTPQLVVSATRPSVVPDGVAVWVSGNIQLGPLGITSAGLSGSWSFLNGVTVSSIVAPLTDGVRGTLSLNPLGTVKAGGMTISGGRLSMDTDDLVLTPGPGKRVRLGNVIVSRNLEVGESLKIDPVNRAVGINVSTLIPGAVVVSGDVLIGRPSVLPAGLSPDRSDLYVEGNLVLGGELIQPSAVYSGLSVVGTVRMAYGVGSTVVMGDVSGDPTAKLTVKGNATGDLLDLRNGGGTSVFRVAEDGRVVIGSTPATAWLTIRGGTTQAPSLRLASGTLTTTPMAGALEFANNTLYFSPQDGVRSEVLLGGGTQVIRNKQLQNAMIESAQLQRVTIEGPLTLSSTGSHIVVPSTQNLLVSLGAGKGMYVGANPRVPSATLDIEGGIRVATADTTTPGTIEFRNGRFYGRTSTGLVALDNTVIDTAFISSPTTLTTSLNVGIGLNREPVSALEVAGVVSASRLVGDGSGLTNIRFSSLAGLVPVSKGGTGLTDVPMGHVLVGNTSVSLNTVALTTSTSILIGTDEGIPTVARLMGGTGISLIRTGDQLTIDQTKLYPTTQLVT